MTRLIITSVACFMTCLLWSWPAASLAEPESIGDFGPGPEEMMRSNGGLVRTELIRGHDPFGDVLSVPIKDDKPVMKLRASCSEPRVRVGEQFSVTTALVNISSRTVELEHFVPWNIFPEVWDVSGKEKLPGVPSFAFDQVLQRKTTRLAPGEEIQLRSVPLVLKDTPVGDARAKEPPGLRAYWNSVKPGRYCLRYSVELKDFLAGLSGKLVSNDLVISVEE